MKKGASWTYDTPSFLYLKVKKVVLFFGISNSFR